MGASRRRRERDAPGAPSRVDVPIQANLSLRIVNVKTCGISVRSSTLRGTSSYCFPLLRELDVPVYPMPIERRPKQRLADLNTPAGMTLIGGATR